MAKIGNVEDNNLLGSKVFHMLQDDIINGVYKPGESLIESKLSSEMGVSRTPIREAIRKLELEGLVQCVPNKGVIVTGISPKDIADIYAIRAKVEGLAVKWAIENITQQEIEHLKEVLDLEEFYTRKNLKDNLFKIDSEFHEIIYKASRSRPLILMLTMFHHYIQRARNASLEMPGRADRALDEHKAIYAAIVDKDAQRAEKLITLHINNAKESLLKA